MAPTAMQLIAALNGVRPSGNDWELEEGDDSEGSAGLC